VPENKVGSEMQLEIQCPVHGEIETLELPDGYKDFEGDVMCPTPVGGLTGGAHLRIKVVDGRLISVERSR